MPYRTEPGEPYKVARAWKYKQKFEEYKDMYKYMCVCVYIYIYIYIYICRDAVALRLRYYATSRKVAGLLRL
jgi:hypothetical protein